MRGELWSIVAYLESLGYLVQIRPVASFAFPYRDVASVTTTNNKALVESFYPALYGVGAHLPSYLTTAVMHNSAWRAFLDIFNLCLYRLGYQVWKYNQQLLFSYYNPNLINYFPALLIKQLFPKQLLALLLVSMNDLLIEKVLSFVVQQQVVLIRIRQSWVKVSSSSRLSELVLGRALTSNSTVQFIILFAHYTPLLIAATRQWLQELAHWLLKGRSFIIVVRAKVLVPASLGDANTILGLGNCLLKSYKVNQ